MAAVSDLQDEHVLEVCFQPCECSSSYWPVHLEMAKMVDFMLCIFIIGKYVIFLKIITHLEIINRIILLGPRYSFPFRSAAAL